MLCCQGVVQAINAMRCARASQRLGAGRSKAGEAIDFKVGLYFTVALGDAVQEGQLFFITSNFECNLTVCSLYRCMFGIVFFFFVSVLMSSDFTNPFVLTSSNSII